MLNLAVALAAIQFRLAPEPAIAALAGPSILTYFLMWFDKLRARAGRSRVPEKVLACAALAGGAVGFLMAALLFRHKIRNLRLMLLGVVALVLQGALVAILR